jgi:hypothetical protein
MPEVIFNGPEGRLEGRYQPGRETAGPIALILHPSPQHGGTMNNKVVYSLFHTFLKRGFACLRFNFRGVGRSQGAFSRGEGELSDAASALDWLQGHNQNSRECWVAGFSFGAWIGMQLLMRRPEISGFITVAPPANMYDFSFLAPCPSSGLVVSGSKDEIVPTDSVVKLVEKMNHQRDINVVHKLLNGANHFFQGELESLEGCVGDYISEAVDTTGGAESA